MTSSSESPIGFFDSGVGGLTVLDAFLDEADSFPYHYLADTAHCPYGDRPLEEVREFALASTGFLVRQGCRNVVMACNISSSIALEEARKTYPGVNIHGLLNERLAAVVASKTNSNRVGVLATSGTVKSRRYPELLSGHDLMVKQQSCSPLVPLVESGELSGPIVRQTLDPLVRPLLEAGVDLIVLGCTHYPFLEGAIREFLPKQVKLLDPGRILARKLAGELSLKASRPKTNLWATGERDSLNRLVGECEELEFNSIKSTSLKTLEDPPA